MLTRFHLATVAFAISGCTMAGQLGFGSRSQPSRSAQDPTPTPTAQTSNSTPGAANAPDNPFGHTPDPPHDPFRKDAGGCEGYVSISDDVDLEVVVGLMKCPNDEVRDSGRGSALGSGRAGIRGRLDNAIIDDPAQLPRAAYVHLCARQMKQDDRLYPAMAIGCLWHADRLDMTAFTKELQARPAADRGVIAKQVAEDIRLIHDRTLAAFPKKAAAREWEIFYELPTRVRKESIARRTSQASVYQRLIAFETEIQSGNFANCEKPLREALTAHLRGAATMPAITERITDPVGYALAEDLARCHYYNERELKAGALVVLLEKARRRVTLAEQIVYARLDALAVDFEKAPKFPNLVGIKYSSVRPGDLGADAPWSSNQLDEKWRFQVAELTRFQTREGRVARVEKTSKGAVIHFQKERVPLVDLKCSETNKIDRIDREGKIQYRSECIAISRGQGWSNPAPVTVDDANGVTAGRYVRVGLNGDIGVVLSCSDHADEKARIHRVADVLVGQ
jgi:hypothetical protein